MAGDDALVREASEIARLLQETSRLYHEQAIDDEIRRSGLTMPQVSAIIKLFDRGPLSLKDLSQEMGLSHSTVSGIVDRLERRDLVRREVDANDRRLTRISVSSEVQAYVDTGLVEAQLGRLLPALRSASPKQRKRIREGLELLHTLVGKPPSKRD